MLTGHVEDRGGGAGTRRRCAVLGSPIAHSLSPVLHRAAYRALGLDWQYDAVEMTADGLSGFLEGLGPQWRGLSLTMPLKRAVMPLLDEVSDTARAAGAANTVVLGDDGRRFGHNTDVPGMRRALQERGVTSVVSAEVVGGGATATSALLALAAMGCRAVTLRVRDPRRAEEVVAAARWLPDPPDIRVLRLDAPGDRPGGGTGDATGDAVDLVVSTIPAAAQPPFADALVARGRVVFDVLYDPWPTPLARAAATAGRPCVGGLDLLVHQATRQVVLMTGCAQAPLSAMRTAGRAALGQREAAEPGKP